jgi:hypothetical protein
MTEGTAPEKVIVNGQEYDPEDATQLIELGHKYKEIESKLNTSLDKVYPEYTKTAQEKAQLAKELEASRAEIERIKAERAEKQERTQLPTDVQNVRKAAREVGLVDEDFIKEKGYMTRDEVDKYLEEKRTMERQAEEVLNTASKFEKEIDGSDGRVPFVKEGVLAYAATYGITDLKEAYEKLNERGNAKWRDAQIAAAEKPGLTTLQPGGKKQPQRVKITNDNLSQMLGEVLNGIPE